VFALVEGIPLGILGLFLLYFRASTSVVANTITCLRAGESGVNSIAAGCMALGNLTIGITLIIMTNGVLKQLKKVKRKSITSRVSPSNTRTSHAAFTAETVRVCVIVRDFETC
jgi:hypothetical protein